MINEKPLKIDAETEFFKGLIELQYGLNVEDKLCEISKDVSWARNWPEDKKSFWNAEAFMWNKKIDKEIRELIRGEVKFLSGGKNLDLGCGSYSYLKSVGFDISEKMLNFNDNCPEKVIGDLENDLPFFANTFDSVTVIFVLNYVKGYVRLLQEVKRVLKEGGIFVVVLSSKKINSWQRKKEVNDFLGKKWYDFFLKSGFKVNFYEKEDLFFFKCLV